MKSICFPFKVESFMSILSADTTEDDEEDAKVVAATDMAFQIIRNGKECPQPWSAFS
jgi:hypothetical protein